MSYQQSYLSGIMRTPIGKVGGGIGGDHDVSCVS